MDFSFDINEIVEQLERSRGEQIINVYIRDPNIINTILEKYIGMSADEFHNLYYNSHLKISFELERIGLLIMKINAYAHDGFIDDPLERLEIKYRKRNVNGYT